MNVLKFIRILFIMFTLMNVIFANFNYERPTNGKQTKGEKNFQSKLDVRYSHWKN